MNTRALLFLALCVVLPARAQDDRNAAPEALSAREEAYGRALGERLGIAVSMQKFTIERPDGRARLLIVGTADQQVLRYKFASRAQAHSFVVVLFGSTVRNKVPVMGELRGDQLVLVCAESMARPEAVQRVRRHVWDGLPCSDTIDATFVALPTWREVAVTTTLRSGPIRDAVVKLNTSAMSALSAGKPWVRRTSSTSTRTELDGLVAEVRCDEEGGAYYTAPDVERAGAVFALLCAIGGEPTGR